MAGAGRVLLAGDWFVLREKYCWLVADKPSEDDFIAHRIRITSLYSCVLN
jgi:hypothetical protein